jgi:hypothetical protein
MKKEHKMVARLLGYASCFVGAIFLFQQLDRIGNWQFFAALIGFLIFVGFAILVVRKTSG